jgi:cob(I)alamin adenosyltransferase
MADPKDQSSAERFAETRVRINRVYTKKGDQGTTQLVGGQRVSKADRRIAAYGTVDELNACIGLARAATVEAARARPRLDELARSLLRVQHELFNTGSILATLPADVHPQQARVTPADVTSLEQQMDRCNLELEPLRSFVLPGGGRINAALHLARTVCRRAERECVALAMESEVDPLAIVYLNRLSDALFVWSRFASFVEEVPEILWDPNKGG